jgi:hypothetical protein
MSYIQWHLLARKDLWNKVYMMMMMMMMVMLFGMSVFKSSAETMPASY